MQTSVESSTGLLTTGAAARRLNCSPQHLRNLIHSGAIPATFIPDSYQGRYYVRPADIEAFETRQAYADHKAGDDL
ncbi:helix-turn-helix domain-containing protein [Kocuria sp.]|uniref:helix-turn-helix domain-containing protein n=1 Tax=Kocuria sp. TaxID=1871328 RepID=UPI0026DFE4A3|nr:helix-turn-helix domain-containing protein [Kocuria sp.]MDO5618035.1 helix-turn-helix domain-containing protein [Kocuria sp.]